LNNSKYKEQWLAPNRFVRGALWAEHEVSPLPDAESTALWGLSRQLPYHRLQPGDWRVAVDTFEASRSPAGIRLELEADDARVEIGLDCDPSRVGLRKRAAGTELEVWCEEARVDSAAVPAGHSMTSVDLGPGHNIVYLPEGMGPRVTGLRVTQGAVQAASKGPTWLAYGDSITEGWLATAPALAWPAIVARRSRLDLCNLGFAGAARGENPVAEQIAAIPSADLISIAYGTNCWNRTPKSIDQVTADLAAFLEIVRGGHAEAPILVISPIVRPDAEQTPNSLGATLAELRMAMESTAAAARRVTVISGRELVSESDLVDGIHPGNEGHAAIATAVSEASEGLDIGESTSTRRRDGTRPVV
jgi:lysophospholipase L1-like esterase